MANMSGFHPGDLRVRSPPGVPFEKGIKKSMLSIIKKVEDIINTLDPDIIQCSICYCWAKQDELMQSHYHDGNLCLGCYDKVEFDFKEFYNYKYGS